MITRLQQVLSAWQPEALWSIEPGTAGVASPHRVATEWAGFRVAQGERHYYAKVLHDDQKPLIDAENVFAAARAAAEQGLTPPLLHTDSEQGVALYSALEEGWHWATLDQLTRPQNLQKITQMLDRLHQISLPLPGRHDAMLKLRQRCETDSVTLPDELLWLGECVDLAWEALAVQAKPSVLIHGDPIASNWLVNERGEWQLLDFDSAALDDPWYDTAVLLNETLSFDDQWREAIRNWYGSCSEADFARCRLYALADDYYWTLWGFWSGQTSPRGLEFTKVGQWTLLRCRQSASDPRLERWLALVAGRAA